MERQACRQQPLGQSRRAEARQVQALSLEAARWADVRAPRICVRDATLMDTAPHAGRALAHLLSDSLISEQRKKAGSRKGPSRPDRSLRFSVPAQSDKWHWTQ